LIANLLARMGETDTATRVAPSWKTRREEFGYQGKATPAETYREGLKELKGF